MSALMVSINACKSYVEVILFFQEVVSVTLPGVCHRHFLKIWVNLSPSVLRKDSYKKIRVHKTYTRSQYITECVVCYIIGNWNKIILSLSLTILEIQVEALTKGGSLRHAFQKPVTIPIACCLSRIRLDPFSNST